MVKKAIVIENDYSKSTGKRHRKEDKNEANKPKNAQNSRHIASVGRPKWELMKEIYEEVKDENFRDEPLVCIMDGALILLF